MLFADLVGFTEMSMRMEPKALVDLLNGVFTRFDALTDRYGLEIYERQRRMLLDWHRDDPPDDLERRRNRLIGEVQGNRNPWID